jgi:hypothetical protein
MARVKTFLVHDRHGVPDREVSDFISNTEKDMGLVRITMQHVKSNTANLLTVVITKADDYEHPTRSSRELIREEGRM